MIGGRHIRHAVAAKEQRVLPLTRQGTDETLRNDIVDTVAAVFQVGEQLIPEVLQVIDRLFHQISPGRMPLRSQHIQETEYATDDFLCPQGISLSGYFFSCQSGLAITVFLTIQPADVFQHLFRVQVTALLVGIHELGARMGQAANASSAPSRRHSPSGAFLSARHDQTAFASAHQSSWFVLVSFHSETAAVRSYGRASPEAAPFLPCQPCARKKAHQATSIFPWNSYHLPFVIFAAHIMEVSQVIKPVHSCNVQHSTSSFSTRFFKPS